jgi:hypothetical protein
VPSRSPCCRSDSPHWPHIGAYVLIALSFFTLQAQLAALAGGLAQGQEGSVNKAKSGDAAASSGPGPRAAVTLASSSSSLASLSAAKPPGRTADVQPSVAAATAALSRSSNSNSPSAVTVAPPEAHVRSTLNNTREQQQQRQQQHQQQQQQQHRSSATVASDFSHGGASSEMPRASGAPGASPGSAAVVPPLSLPRQLDAAAQQQTSGTTMRQGSSPKTEPKARKVYKAMAKVSFHCLARDMSACVRRLDDFVAHLQLMLTTCAFSQSLTQRESKVLVQPPQVWALCTGV